MDRTKLLKPLVYLMLFLFLADTLAQKFYWYYSIGWFDIPVHFLGGFWVGIFFVWYFSVVRLPFLRRPLRDTSAQTFRQTLLFVLFIGIAWEAGEFLTSNYIGLEAFNRIDIASDLFFDLAGGVTAFFYCRRKTRTRGPDKVESN